MSDSPPARVNRDLLGLEAELRAEEETRHSWFILILAIPWTLFGFAMLTFLVGGLLAFSGILGVPGGSWLLVAAPAIALVVVAIDTWRHPSEAWYRVRYYLTGGGVAGHTFELGVDNPAGWMLEHQKGHFSGMPLRTKMSRTHNWVERARAVANGMANLALAGPRQIRRAVEMKKLARRRRDPALIAAAAEFLQWLAERGSVPERDLEAELARKPAWGPAAAVSRELGWLVLMTSRRFEVTDRVRVRSKS